MISICNYIEKIAIQKYPSWKDRGKRKKLIRDLEENQELINEMINEKVIEEKQEEILDILSEIQSKED